jgi:hypothetical protein
MRVSELIAVLKELDPDLDLLAHAAHGECQFQFFDVESVEVACAVRSRDESGLHHATLDPEKGRPLAMMTLTADF